MKALTQLRLRWKQIWCEHFWRPALIGKYGLPSRVCDYCWKQEILTQEEFYAHFGRIPRI